MTSKEYEKTLNLAFNEYRKNNQQDLLNGSKYFNQIGSTLLEDIEYSQQLKIKEQILNKLFENFTSELSPSIFGSPKITEYRFKVEFVTSYNPKFEPFNRFGQRKKGNFSWVVDLDEYVLIEKDIFKKARQVYDYAISLGLNGYDLRMNKGDLRYITIKYYKDSSMLVITSANQDERFNQLIDYAKVLGFNSIYWLQNSTKHDSFEGEVIKFEGVEFINIPMFINSNKYDFLVGPFTFFQNNIYCFEVLLEYLDKFIESQEFSSKTLFDLYSGVGLFGIVFAKYFNNIKSVDIVKDSIDLGIKISQLNNIKNIEFEARDIKDMSFTKNRDSVVIVDPPRNGLEEKGLINIMEIEPEYLIYISCNPITLEKDLCDLTEKYSILDLKYFDTFPQTYHVESLCIMKRK